MKNSKICPKCGSERVVSAQNMLNGHGSVFVSVGAVSTARAEYLICCDCGYTELWMPEDKLEKIYKIYHNDPN